VTTTTFESDNTEVRSNIQGLWGFLNNPRRVAGVFGIAFVVLFLIGGPLLQGETPTVNDDVQAIRAYWEEDGDRYLAGDFLFGIAVVLFFLPFVVALRSVLAPADRSGGMWASMMLVGALVAVVLGGAGAAASAGLALEGAGGLDDATLLFATRAGACSLAGLGLGFALMLIGAAVVIAQTGVLWRWLAVLAVLAAVANIVGGLWVPDGDQGGAFGVLGFIGVIGAQIWVLAVSIQMLLPSKRS
jgi:hypothetical protein